MQSIKFTTHGGNPLVGQFGPGDIARVPEKLAKHFVVDAKCARYMESEAAPEPVKAQRKKRGR